MLVKVFVCLLFVSVVSTRSVTQDNNNKYIIVLKDGCSLGEIERVQKEIEEQEQLEGTALQMEHINNLIPMVFANIGRETAMKILDLPEVSYVERDQPVYMAPLTDTHSNTPEWLGTPMPTDRYNLDIMNKPTHGCRNNQYNPPNAGTGADIYILDTGINYSHVDFLGIDGHTRAEYGGYDAINPSTGGQDCHGHGSHCAGIAAGLQSGVAKNANLFSIRVLNCQGGGSNAGIIIALDFVAGLHKKKAKIPCFVASIVSMSLQTGRSNAYNAAVNALVGEGVIVVTSSGNDGADACQTSPGSAGDNINVGAHSEPVEVSGVCTDPIESFSNYGECVHVIAPGRDILSVYYANNVDFARLSGTSMACPHVAGAAALIMREDTSLTPQQVKDKIIELEADDITRPGAYPSQRLYVPSQF